MALGDIPQGSVSITDRVQSFDVGAPIVAAHLIDATAMLVGGDEQVWRIPEGGAPEAIAVHGGGILCSRSDGKRVVTGGDDGRVVEISANGAVQDVATDAKRRWIDNLALHQDGAIAWSAGKTAFVRSAKGDVRALDVASTVGGLAFAPKGVRLAVARYNGVTLWFPNVAGAPDELEWKGSHLAVGFSPDGKFVCTSMLEAAMHGWRIADGRHLRMSGYPGRVKSFGWSADGRWMATSGADAIILWPFQTKDGPIGKQPLQYAPLTSRVSVIACHPREDMLAAGYGDGTVLLVRIKDGAEILVNRPNASEVTALTWNARGDRLLFACANGAAGIAPL